MPDVVCWTTSSDKTRALSRVGWQEHATSTCCHAQKQRRNARLRRSKTDPTTHGERLWMTDRGQTEDVRRQGLRRPSPGLGHHKKKMTKHLKRDGLGDSQRRYKQLKNETGAPLRGGIRQASHLHLLPPAQRHTRPGILGPQGEPNLGLVSEEGGSRGYNSINALTLNAHV